VESVTLEPVTMAKPNPVPATAMKVETPVAEPVASQAPSRKVEPKIFIPDRPPDDPGPGIYDLDETTTTPVGRFRTASK
jgi:hypothetical protein